VRPVLRRRREYDPERMIHSRLSRLRAKAEVPIINGPRDRIKVSPDAVLGNVLISTECGTVEIGDYAFFGHDAMLLTGGHDYALTGRDRLCTWPTSGRDIVIEPGVWVASRAIILGPCRIGANSVIGAGCVVNFDVPADTIVRQRQDLVQEPIRFRGR
jgi:acetyltransferase-like isoleucine patch superfamily enzyme